MTAPTRSRLANSSRAASAANSKPKPAGANPAPHMAQDPAPPAAPSVVISGPGKGQLLPQGSGFVLELVNTSAASNVSLVNTGGTQLALVGISANSAVGAMSLANADLSGTAAFASSVVSLTLGQLSQALVSVAAGNTFSFKAAELADVQLLAPTANVNVDVKQWTGSAAGVSVLKAAGLASLVTKGDMGADLLLTGTPGLPNLFTLNSVQIGGALSGGLWSVHGRANSISAGSSAPAWRANISGPVVMFTTQGEAAGSLAVAALQMLKIDGAARSLRVLVGADLGDDAALGGSGANADHFHAGGLARVRIGGDVVDTSLIASVDPVDGVLNDGNDTQIGTAAQALLEFIAGGQLLGSTSIVAPAFPASVRVGGRDLDPATLPQFSHVPPDRLPPVLRSFGLDAASDTGTPGDNKTSANPVTLAGATQAGTTLKLRHSGDPTVLSTATAAADGSFSLAGITLALGDNTFDLTLADAAGNLTVASLHLLLEPAGDGDTTAPTLEAALQTDTGLLADDGVTRDASIAGRATDDVRVTQLLVSLDPGPIPSFTDLAALLEPDGRFTLSRAVLDTLAGGSLADGAHTVRLIAKDAAGNASAPLNIVFTLDRQAPGGASFAVSTVDAFNGNTAQTASAIVVLQGTAETGATIRLAAQGLISSASANGNFMLPGVALALGDNFITLDVSDAAGNSQSVTRTLTRVQPTQGDAVLDWITTALKAVQLDVTHPQVATRTLAMLSIAVHDSLAAIQGTPAYLVQRSASDPTDAQAAAAQAAYRVLFSQYPGQRTKFDAALAASLAARPDGAAKSAGVALGESIAQAILALRADDGNLEFAAEDDGTAPGQWRATGPFFLVAEEPQWPRVTPFALESAAQFRAAPPPALDSAAYAEAINQVQSLGRDNSITRSADQTQQAQFWADGGGSFTPPGHWDQIAVQVAAAKGQSLSANARLMAQLNVALADAAIAAWDTKYHYNFWRPITAIQNADQDGNPATVQDANWTPLLITPAHPSYVSGHSTFSAAAAGVLAASFGDNTAFATTASTLPGVTRSFTSFSEAADEAGLSRIYGGIHTILDNDAGKLIGTQVAQAVLARFALTRDTQPPQIVLDATPDSTNTNLVITGQVLDNLSGVAGAQIRVDGGTAQDLAVDAQGKFRFTTTFATDGSADGSHSVALSASDAAGNQSAALTHAFTLVTLAPQVSLTSLAEGDSLQASSRLSGNASVHGGVLAQLSYQFDGDIIRQLPFDESGSFDSALDFSTLTIGSHTLSVTARDSAGNAGSTTLHVNVAALPLFMLSGFSPTDGSINVGVTQRPFIQFSRAVNPATLTADSLFATAPDGSKLASTLVPAVDGTFVWMFFASPLPGGSRITVHLDGGLIRAAADGALLDADNNGEAAGVQRVSFTTVSRSAVAGTRIIGKVLDPGPDLKPMSFDDIRRGPDGVIHTADDVFLLPIAHAMVFILGQEDRVIFTDANGEFEFNEIPAGDLKLVVDGRTATNAPAGVFFPEMVMDAAIQAGVTNTMMGSMGAVEERLANTTRREIYLPRVPLSVLQEVSDTEPTVIRVDDPRAAPQLTDQQRQALTLKINPGRGIGFDGKPVSNTKLGVSTVPPELVKDMLPEGVLQHTFDITIQAPGVATFTEPVEISFPNVFSASPGAQLAVLSFDHTTGMLVINGTATVSADGLSVVSEPGAGVRAPGWHGLTPPGGCGGSGGQPPGPVPPAGAAGLQHAAQALDVIETVTIHDPIALTFATGDGGMGGVTRPEWFWTAPPADPNAPPSPPPPPGCDVPQHPSAPGGLLQPFVNVSIDIDGPLDRFAKALTNPIALQPVSSTFTLAPGSGESKLFGFQAKSYDEMFRSPKFQQLTADQLFGAKITITVIQQKAGELLRTRDVFTYYQYRWVDVIDADKSQNKTGKTAAFIKTLNDGAGNFVRTKEVQVHLPATVSTDFSTVKPFFVDGATSDESTVTWKFDPEVANLFLRELVIKVNDPKLPLAGQVGLLDATGASRSRPLFSVDQAGYRAELKRLLLSLKTAFQISADGTAVNPQVVYAFKGHEGVITPAPTNGGGSIFVLAAGARLNIDYIPVSAQFKAEYAGFMPADRKPGPDGIAGSTDDDFDAAQLAALDTRLSNESSLLLTEVRANFTPAVGDAITFQASNAGADVSTSWGDQIDPADGSQVFGLSNKADYSIADMRNDIGTQGRVDPATGNRFTKPISDSAQIWALSEFLNISLSGTTKMAVGLSTRHTNPNVKLTQLVADSLSHEFGHHLGLNEGYLSGFRDARDIGGTAGIRANADATPYGDIMNAGGDADGNQCFKYPITNLLKSAVGIAPDGGAAMLDTLKFWRDHFNLQNDRHPGHLGDKNGYRDVEAVPLTTPEITLSTGAIDYFGLSLDTLPFDSVAADSSADTHSEVAIQIVNGGVAPLLINALQLGGGKGFALINPPPAGTSIAPKDQISVNLRFDPTKEGDAQDSLTIDSNAGTVPHFVLKLQGTGLRVAPTASVALGNNNLGGLRPGAPAVQRDEIFTLTNTGLQPLVISGAVLTEGAESFSLLGLPADLAIHPISLATGEHLSFGARFAPDHLGLQRGLIELSANDPLQTKLRLGVVGTGLAALPTVQWGKNYFALQNPEQPEVPPLRAISDDNGYFNFFLAASTPYHVVGFDPATGLVAHGYGRTAIGGKGTDLTSSMVFLASTEKDSDYDGLPDDVELAIGSSAIRRDSDADGVDDFTEVKQGGDPLGALRIPIGVVSSAALLGTAEAVTVFGSIDGKAALTALLATGTYGLAVVDVSQFSTLKILSQLKLPGNNTDVAVDAARRLAAVAGNEAGLHIVDIAIPAAPLRVQTVPFGSSVNRVKLSDGIAYVTAGASVHSVDINTGELVSSLDLAGSTLLDIAVFGSTAYTVDAAGALRTLNIANASLAALGALTLPAAGGQLFVGNSVAYVGAGNGVVGGGFSTVDVSNPSLPVLLSGPDNTVVAGSAIALNGSGLALAVGGNDSIVAAFRSLDVFSTADPANTGNLVTRINLPQMPKDLALAGGLAFVADGSGGLQVVNYLGADVQGVAPQAAITLEAVDVDASQPGVQVQEGRVVRVLGNISDDVQVRSVELLVNGQVASVAVAFPFEFTAQAPAIALAGEHLTLQVRAADTGGNVSLSEQLALDVVPDTLAPQLLSASVDEGARRFFVRSIDLLFDEPLDLQRLTPSAATLVRAGADGSFGTPDDEPVPLGQDTRKHGQLISLLLSGLLAPGSYELRVDAAQIADLAGNVLAAPIVRHFTVLPANTVRALSGSAAIANVPSANPGQQIGVVVPFDPATARMSFKTVDAAGTVSNLVVNVFRTDAAARIAFFNVPLNALTGDAEVFEQVGSVITHFDDGTFPLQIVPTVRDVQVVSVAADGTSAQVLVSGSGFVEGANTVYRFGATSVVDTSTSAGPDVQSDGTARLTVPLSAAAFGPVSVTTAGGSSAPFSVNLTGLEASALSGTPAGPALASANAGQAITLVGQGLNTNTDVLLRFTDINGAPSAVRLSPVAASQDGSRASLVVPAFANGVVALQIFGSANQPLLQIVPTLSGADIQSRTVLLGSGFVEGNASYSFAGATVSDSALDAGNHIDVFNDGVDQNRLVNIDRTALPAHGLGNVSVTTAAGSSAAFALNTLRVNLPPGAGIGDVAVDPASAQLWVSDQASPAHLLRLDPATGQVLQTITLTPAFGSINPFNNIGLQQLAAPMLLGSSNVPAGSLLVFNGNIGGPDRVVAVDPASGAVITSLALDARYGLNGAVFNPANGHIYLTETGGPGNRIIELSSASGAQLAAITAPFSVLNAAGLAIDPSSGHLWLGTANGGALLVEYRIDGTGQLSELRRLDASAQNLNQNEVSGLSFAPDGALWVASTQAELYRIDIHAAAAPPASLSQIVASARDGVPANGTQASAHVGQVIELIGAHFTAATRVLFNTRGNDGSTGVAVQTPLIVNVSGTRLQVLVPDTAASGDVKLDSQAGGIRLQIVPTLSGVEIGRPGADDLFRLRGSGFVEGALTVRIGGIDLVDADSVLSPLDVTGPRNDTLDVVAPRTLDGPIRITTEGGSAEIAVAPIAPQPIVGFTAITATASAGTPANANAPSAVNGQAIALHGQGLATINTLVQFQARDDSGTLGTVTLNGIASADGTTLTVGVPALVRSGLVTILGSGVSLPLQIVPVLRGIGGQVASGQAIVLEGSGFNAPDLSVTIDGRAVTGFTVRTIVDGIFDSSASKQVQQLLSLTVPAGVGAGVVVVSSSGGSSSLSAASRHLTAINTTAASGSAALAALPSANTGQSITVAGSGLVANDRLVFTTLSDFGNLSELTVTTTVSLTNQTLTAIVPTTAHTGHVRLERDTSGLLLQIVPTVIDLQVESASTDGKSASVLLEGTGILEAADTEYRFGTLKLLDRTRTAGPENLGRFTRVVLPLSDAAFGPISVKTIGGTSTPFSVNVASVNAVAPTGTPADPVQASAHAGQAVSLSGQGLSTTTDVLLRFIDGNGSLGMVKLSPSSAAANGSSANLTLPTQLNGAFGVQVFGSASQPLLQIVPTLTSVDIQSRIILTGTGFVEGNASYQFAGASANDTPLDPSVHIEVTNNTSASIDRVALPSHGLGPVSVSTAGGSSAPLALNTVRVNVPIGNSSLGDVAVDPVSGHLWVSDQASPAHLLRIDPATGQTVQTLTLSAAFGSIIVFNNIGLHVLTAAMTLGSSTVPAGSLLVFNGSVSGNDRVLAVDTGSGAVIASLNLDATYRLTGAAFNPANGHIYLTESNGPANRIIELSAASGAQLAAVTAPFGVQTGAGLAIAPATGHLWFGSVSSGALLVELRIDGTSQLTELRRLDASTQNLNQNEISGLSFAADGALWVASTQGEVYRINT